MNKETSTRLRTDWIWGMKGKEVEGDSEVGVSQLRGTMIACHGLSRALWAANAISAVTSFDVLQAPVE